MKCVFEYQTPPEDTKRCVLDAIGVGYRSIDTAQAYYGTYKAMEELYKKGKV